MDERNDRRCLEAPKCLHRHERLSAKVLPTGPFCPLLLLTPFPLNSACPVQPRVLTPPPYNLIIPPTYLLTDIQQELIQFANTIGRKKVMFGTNFPQLNWKACIESVHKHTKLREDSKADFFGGNAARVLKLDGVSEKKARL
jgi:hypothetical protein